MKFFKLRENGKVCKVVSIETNLIGGKGFDAFITIVEPNHCDVEGWDCERVVAACRGEFVDSPIEANDMKAEKYNSLRRIVTFAPGYNKETLFAALSDSEFYKLLQEFKRNAKRGGDNVAYDAAERYQDKMLAKL